MAKVVFWNLGILVAGLVICELVFGTWFEETAALYHFTKPRNVTIAYNSSLPGQPARTSYTRDRYGFRGRRGGVGEIFILTVGGSTTDQRFIHDGLTYEDGLERLWSKNGRGVDIVNAGIDGQTTFGHIENFRHWFRHIPDLKPRYILFYVGVNDFFEEGRREKFDDLSDTEGFVRYLKDKSALRAAYKVIQSIIRPPRVAHSPRLQPWSTARFTDVARVSEYRTPAVLQSLASLRARIATLAELTAEIGAKAIFVTQRSISWVRDGTRIIGTPAGKGGRRKGPLADFGPLSGVDLHNLERLQAEAILGACRESGSTCIDLAGEIEIDPATDFYDDVHTTPAGSAKIAAYLFEKLRDLP